MTTYTTIRVPDGIDIRHVKDFANRLGFEVRTHGFQLVLVDPTVPSNVRRLPARPRPVTTGPDVGGAA